MPIIKSAKKRVRTAEKAAIRNAKTKRTFRTALKDFHKAITGGSKALGEVQAKAHSELDKAAKKGILHKNKVARLKAQLAKAAKAAGSSVTATPKKTATAAKKTTATAKKETAAKAPAAAKKTAATTKTAVKKPAAKKAAPKK